MKKIQVGSSKTDSKDREKLVRAEVFFCICFIFLFFKNENKIYFPTYNHCYRWISAVWKNLEKKNFREKKPKDAKVLLTKDLPRTIFVIILLILCKYSCIHFCSGTHNCPDGWESYNGYCYQINAHPAQTLNWTDARALCQAFSEPWKKLVDVASADLVSITSQDEHDYVDRLFKSYKLSGYNDYYWVGLYKNGTNDGFHWTDGSKNSYQDWQNTPHGVNNSCVKSSLYSTQKSSWIAASCTEKHYFVCKVKRGL